MPNISPAAAALTAERFISRVRYPQSAAGHADTKVPKPCFFLQFVHIFIWFDQFSGSRQGFSTHPLKFTFLCEHIYKTSSTIDLGSFWQWLDALAGPTITALYRETQRVKGEISPPSFGRMDLLGMLNFHLSPTYVSVIPWCDLLVVCCLLLFFI